MTLGFLSIVLYKLLYHVLLFHVGKGKMDSGLVMLLGQHAVSEIRVVVFVIYLPIGKYV